MLISCALLTKVFTAYVFYASAGLILFIQKEYRRFLLSPSTLLILATALLVPYLWFSGLPQHGGQSGSMLNEVMVKLATQNWGSYVRKLLAFPLEAILRLSPVALLAAYVLLRKRVTDVEEAPTHFRTALLIALLCALPYWLSPQSSIRYLMPIYPLIALICARLIWRAGKDMQSIALRWMLGIIIFKFIFALVLYPYYQSHFRGANYTLAAQDISRQVTDYPIYAYDLRSVGESIVSELDIIRLPSPPIQAPPTTWDNGFLIAMEPDQESQLFIKLKVTNDDLYLLCRGAACSSSPILKQHY